MEELQNVLRLELPHRRARALLGAVLLADGAITAEQLERALTDVEARGCRVGEALISAGATVAALRSTR